MIYKKNIKNLGFSCFIIFITFLVILLKRTKASISASTFTYYNGIYDINVELLETEYVSIFNIKSDSPTEHGFEISNDYVISDDNETKNCNVLNNSLGEIITKQTHTKKFLLVQKRDSKVYIKDKKNLW
ncbi:hypothetical protein POWCR01_120071400 [Plasmodium ovale]|uniref:Uncharacterized protein n=1 Tax=Plasmodium ovale TaxID=36330 RepID=A0A1C3KWH8_PLAOA|nr:hypothetical protein POWCR01_120071400 [Plasmodium ovale]